MKPREPRRDVSISVRFVADAQWANAEVRNVSEGGLMAVATSVPSRGTYVEIRRESYCIVGRVVWSSGTSFGLEAREKIEFAELARPRPKERRGDRRADPVARSKTRPRKRDFDEQAQASVRFARAFQFAVTSAIVATFAYFVADQAGEALATPLRAVGAALNEASVR